MFPPKINERIFPGPSKRIISPVVIRVQHLLGPRHFEPSDPWILGPFLLKVSPRQAIGNWLY